MLFDSHCHLNDDHLYGHLDEVVHDALLNDVGGMICIGYDPEANARAMEIAHRFPFVYAAVGFHPELAHEVKASDWMVLEALLADPKVVAIGECGLDYYWDKSHKAEQTAVFIRQIQLANQYKKPLVVHMREATGDTYDLLKAHKDPGLPGVMHCYSGSVESMIRFIDLNLNISFAGPVTFKNAKNPKETAASVPDARLMIETDSPYLAPMPFRGKDNGPKFLKFICQAIADLRGTTYDQVSALTSANASRLFRLPGNGH